ncbi:MAG: hypothetical protein WCK82_05340 [Bacteroidota bacterium]
MNEDDLRDAFAMFAMLGFMSRGSVWEFKEAYEIADGMVEARKQKEEPEIGIVAVKKRKTK